MRAASVHGKFHGICWLVNRLGTTSSIAVSSNKGPTWIMIPCHVRESQRELPTSVAPRPPSTLLRPETYRISIYIYIYVAFYGILQLRHAMGMDRSGIHDMQLRILHNTNNTRSLHDNDIGQSPMSKKHKSMSCYLCHECSG